jgi:hypothetical protein
MDGTKLRVTCIDRARVAVVRIEGNAWRALGVAATFGTIACVAITACVHRQGTMFTLYDSALVAMRREVFIRRAIAIVIELITARVVLGRQTGNARVDLEAGDAAA